MTIAARKPVDGFVNASYTCGDLGRVVMIISFIETQNYHSSVFKTISSRSEIYTALSANSFGDSATSTNPLVSARNLSLCTSTSSQIMNLEDTGMCFRRFKAMG